jgi:hypothetical protein
MSAAFTRWTFLLVFSMPAAFAADALQSVDKTAGEWIKLRLETARLETEWQTQRGLVESTVAALKERAGALEEKRDLVKAKTAKDREELDALRGKIQSASDDLNAFDARLKALAEKLTKLRPNLPPHLSEALEMSYRSLADGKSSPGERMQVAMNVLNRCAQFNRLISVGEDVLSLAGEPPQKSFEVIYWGLSHGYAIDRGARKAWLGSPGSNGWRWEQTDAFDGVVKLIAIANDKAEPEFVAIPAVATRSLTEAPRN